jgi:hypothetical protein
MDQVETTLMTAFRSGTICNNMWCEAKATRGAILPLDDAVRENPCSKTHGNAGLIPWRHVGERLAWRRPPGPIG